MTNNQLYQTLNIYRISLNFDPKNQQTPNLSGNEPNSCCLTNLKKCRELLSAQRNQQENLSKKQESFQQKQFIMVKNCSPPFNPKNRQHQTICAIHRKPETGQKNRDIQNIQIDAHCLRKDNRVSSTKRQNGQPANPYKTITPEITQKEQSNNRTIVNESEMMKTCPDFKNNQKGRGSCLGKSVVTWQRKKNSLQLMNQIPDLSLKQKRNNILFKKRKNSSVQKKTQVGKIFFNTKINTYNNKNSLKSISKKIQPKHLQSGHISKNKNTAIRVTTAPTISSLAHHSQIIKTPSTTLTIAHNKTEYKVKLISVPQELLKRDLEEHSVFPVCRKITMSTLDRCYELCVQEIKEKRWRKKKLSIEKVSAEWKQMNQKVGENNGQGLNGKTQQNFNNLRRKKRNKSEEISHDWGQWQSSQRCSQSNTNKDSIEANLAPLLTAVRIEKINLHQIEESDLTETKEIKNKEKQFIICTRERCRKRQFTDSSHKNKDVDNSSNDKSDNHMRNNYRNTHSSGKKWTKKTPTLQMKQKNPQQCQSNETLSQPINSVTNMSRKLQLGYYNTIEDAPLNAWETPKNHREVSNFCSNIQFNL